MSDSKSDMGHKLRARMMRKPYMLMQMLQEKFWLYEVTRRGNCSQLISESILKNEKVRRNLETTELQVQIKWANVVHYMFEDLLNGRLFFSIMERRSLFLTWNWMFSDKYMPYIGDSDLVDFVTNIVMTPLLEQEEIFHTWVVFPENKSILSQYYTTWLSDLITEVTKHGL